MKPDTNPNGSIPSRKGVHFRSTSTSKSNMPPPVSAKASIKSDIKSHTSPSTGKSAHGNIAHPGTPKQIPVEAFTDKDLAATEKKLTALLNSETKKTALLKKNLHQKSIQRFLDKLGKFGKCLIIGLFAFSIISLFVIFIYYRSISKYDAEEAEFSIRFFNYIDPYDTSEKNIEKSESRKNGTESPEVSLKTEIIIRDTVPYIPYSLVKNYFDFSIAGNSESRTISVGRSDSDYNEINTANFKFNSNEIEINGVNQVLSGTAFMKNNEFYFPYEFIEYYIRGIKIDKTTDDRHTSLSITKTMPDIYFGGSSNESLRTPKYSDILHDSSAIHEYMVDISAYEKYINPKDNDKYLILVNRNNILSPEYVPQELYDVETIESRPVQQICFDAAMSLTAMLLAADAAGFDDLAVTTGYRSYSYQSSLFNQKLKVNLQKFDETEAEKITTESVIYPGASEHQTGLAVDVHNLSSPMQTFANSDEYKWLIEHCADFGFILRYPQTKEGITGVKYEPWHFRFVGREHAQKIMSEGITLEEYLANKSDAENLNLTDSVN